MSYLGESARIFMGIRGRHVGDEVRSRSVGDVFLIVTGILGHFGWFL